MEPRREVLVVKPRGFCAGVVRAIDTVEIALQRYGSPVYSKHAIVHNEAVVAELEAKGVIFVERVEEVPEGAVVIFSAHGSPPEDYTAAKARGLTVIDATCPLVARVHNEARKFAAEGAAIFVIGHRDHVEVKGTLGQALNEGADVHLVDPVDPVWDHHAEWDDPPVIVLTQTTLSQDDVAPVVAKIRDSFPNAKVKVDICYATTNRQEAVKYLASEVNLVLVIGSEQSSNSRRLVEAAKRAGGVAYLVQNKEGIPWVWVRGGLQIGVTSGASTPERLVEEVVASLEATGYTRREIEVVPEDVTFKLPEGVGEYNGCKGMGL